MEQAGEFTFGPLPPIDEPATFAASGGNLLGPLAGLAGKWSGRGFNVIWRPRPQKDAIRGPVTIDNHFLELNLTDEQLDFSVLRGQIPNRGLLQPDIPLHGLSYLQQISDANLNKGQHFEPGLWVLVPLTTHPQEPPTVARLASIPHGTTILAQGTAHTADGPPTIPDISIKPFPNNLNHPPTRDDEMKFPEPDLSEPSDRRTGGAGLHGITQKMVNNPNSVLHASVPPVSSAPRITRTTKLQVSTDGPLPGSGTRPGSGTLPGSATLPDGGIANIAFLKGGGDGPNALVTRVTATFWLETLQGDPEPRQLQYSQVVLLEFLDVLWPHVTVATLHKKLPAAQS